MEKVTRNDEATTSATRVTKLKRFAMTMFAAATVAFSMLAAPSTASAERMSCKEAAPLADVFYAMGDYFFAAGRPLLAFAWWNRADQTLIDCEGHY